MTSQDGADNIKVVEVSHVTWLNEIGKLRAEVWRADGFDVPDLHARDPNIWIDELDKRSVHWIGLHGEELAGAARLSLHRNVEEVVDYEWFKDHLSLAAPVASFNRLVVRQEARGLGLGKQFDRARIAKARALGARSICVAAVGAHRVAALTELGFRVVFVFAEGHGLLIPEQEMTGMTMELKS